MATVALSPLFNGWQGFDTNGKPLNGGLINTYVAGSSTPTPTYTTSGGGVQNTNPIVLGADGRPPQEIWLDITLAYKFVLTDSLANVLGTYDNLSGIITPAVLAADALTIVSLTVTDASFFIQNTTDSSKKAKFSASTISTGTIQTYTLPNASGTVVLGSVSSFTVSLTGCTATVTGTASYSLQNNGVILDLPILTGTSTTTACTITGIPSAIIPITVKTAPMAIENNSTPQVGVAQLGGSVLTLVNNFSVNFSSTGVKGLLYGGTMCYTLTS